MTRQILIPLILLSMTTTADAQRRRCVSRSVVVATPAVVATPVVAATPQTLIQTQNVFSTTSASTWGGRPGQMTAQQQYEFLQQINRELQRQADRQEQLVAFARQIQQQNAPAANPYANYSSPYAYNQARPPYQAPRASAAPYGGYGSRSPGATRGDGQARPLQPPPWRRPDQQQAAEQLPEPQSCPGPDAVAARCGSRSLAPEQQPPASRQLRSIPTQNCRSQSPSAGVSNNLSATRAACVNCHGPANAEKDLRLDGTQALTAEMRRLAVKRMLEGEMPPDRSLSVDEIWRVASELLVTEEDRRQLLDRLTRPNNGEL